MPHTRRKRNPSLALPGNYRGGEFVRVAGPLLGFAAEMDHDPKNIDHVWVTIDAGGVGPLRISLSTSSRNNAALGFDPRMRSGVVTGNWVDLPEPGIFDSPSCDYAALEREVPVIFAAHDRPALEELLLACCERALFIEAWGELYVRGHLGIHQVHSRRRSDSVPKDIKGRDGAVRFYFEVSAELWLFKYAGQP